MTTTTATPQWKASASSTLGLEVAREVSLALLHANHGAGARQP